MTATVSHNGSGPLALAIEAEPEALAPDRLRSRFLESLDDADRERVFQVSAQVAQQLDEWAARYPLIRRIRVQPLALSVTAAAPFCSVAELTSSARVSLWVFTLDDIFDEESFGPAELMRGAERYRAIARGRVRASSADDMEAALQDVRDDLARYPLFESIGEEWAEALCGTIDGMVREYEWRFRYRADPGSALPTFDEYVECGLYSIGGPPHVWSAFLTIGDPSTPDHLEHLRPMERTASICVRLANDLQSYAKEVAEGKVNSITILAQAITDDVIPPLVARARAEARVRAEIAEGLSTLATLEAGARTDTGRPERAVANIARFVCEFYSRYDYHTFAAARA